MATKQSPRQIAEQTQISVFRTVDAKLTVIRKEILGIDRQIQPLKDRRAFLCSERDRLQKIKSEPRTYERRNGTGQGLFVHTRYFIDVVREWIDDYDEEHGHGGKTALQLLSGVHAKSVRSYFSGQITYAGIYSVDRLLSAIGREDLLDDMPWKTAIELKLGGHDQKRKREIPNEPPNSHFYED